MKWNLKILKKWIQLTAESTYRDGFARFFQQAITKLQYIGCPKIILRHLIEYKNDDKVNWLHDKITLFLKT